MEPKGKRVKIPHGPATVIGEPPRRNPLALEALGR